MIDKILLSIVLVFSTSITAEEYQPNIEPRIGKMIQTYCITCHNETLRTAGLLLDQVNVERMDQQPAIWEKVVRRLQARSMPPQGMPRPTPADYEFLIAHLEGELNRVAAANPNPGRTVPHRLNRVEYANAIRDILDMEINVEKLLSSDAASGHGFDNIADVLTFSPVLMESYLSAAKTISQQAVGDPDIRPVVEIYLVPENLEQNERVSEDLPFSSRGGAVLSHYFSVDGEYLIRVRLRRITSGGDQGKIIGFTEPRHMEVRLDGKKLKEFTVGGQQETDDDLVIPVSIKSGARSIGVSFLRDVLKPEGLEEEIEDAPYGGGLGWVEVEGPINPMGVGETPSRQKIFSCTPTRPSDEITCAEKILSNLARSAYRRSVSDRDIKPLLELYLSGREDKGFDESVGLAIQGILISPEFLFRIEREPENVKPGDAYTISDTELASRLSFFLWSSVPDEQLLDLAERGKLREPGVLKHQVQRMLQDARSDALVKNFAAQWLHVRNLDLLSPPDLGIFPEYNHNLKTAFQKEIELLFESFIREDRSILEFLNSDYTFLNERLARHYSIPDVYGSHFRRVSLADGQRRGLLGKGSVLTVTSYATRTSPTLRGKWVLENILGTPPPPPPPDIPSLVENAETLKLSMRERMEMHRTNPVCASCHQLMDPLGLALENFDAIGAWRTINVDQTPIDATGRLPDGTEFNGPSELMVALWQGREQFAGTFVERLLTYSLGRAIEYYDMPAVRQILARSDEDDYRWSSIVVQIVESQPFQMRRSIGP